jgi:hypothetical protein
MRLMEGSHMTGTAARLGLALVLVVAGLPVPAVAQTPWSGGTQPAQAPVFKYYVWGQVRMPGAYSLGASPDIVELLSAGGGPTQEANLKRVVLVRAVSKERVRVNVEQMLADGDMVPLSPGDVVIVPRSWWYTVRDQFVVVSTVAVLVNLGLMLYSLSGE